MKNKYFRLVLFILSFIFFLNGCEKKDIVYLSRYEWIEMLGDRFGLVDYQQEKGYFTDVNQDGPLFDIIQSCVENNIIDENNTFDGDELASSEFIVSSLMKSIGLRRFEYLENKTDLTKKDIVACAQKYQIIDIKKIRKGINEDYARSIIENAISFWCNPKYYPEYCHVKYKDNVINTTEFDNVEYNVAENIVTFIDDNYTPNIGDILILKSPENGIAIARKVLNVINSNQYSSVLVERVKDISEIAEIVEFSGASNFSRITNNEKTTDDITLNLFKSNNYPMLYIDCGLLDEGLVYANKIYDFFSQKISLEPDPYTVNLKMKAEIIYDDGGTPNVVSTIQVADKNGNKTEYNFDLNGKESFKNTNKSGTRSFGSVGSSGDNGKISVEGIIENFSVLAEGVIYTDIKEANNSYASVHLSTDTKMNIKASGAMEKTTKIGSIPVPLGSSPVVIEIGLYAVTNLEGKLELTCGVTGAFSEMNVSKKGIKTKYGVVDNYTDFSAECKLSGGLQTGIAVQVWEFEILKSNIDILVMASLSNTTSKSMNYNQNVDHCIDICTAAPLVSVGVLCDSNSVIYKLLGEEYKYSYSIFSEDNAPVKTQYHIEYDSNGKSNVFVGGPEKCTKKDKYFPDNSLTKKNRKTIEVNQDSVMYGKIDAIENINDENYIAHFEMMIVEAPMYLDSDIVENLSIGSEVRIKNNSYKCVSGDDPDKWYFIPMEYYSLEEVKRDGFEAYCAPKRSVSENVMLYYAMFEAVDKFDIAYDFSTIKNVEMQISKNAKIKYIIGYDDNYNPLTTTSSLEKLLEDLKYSSKTIKEFMDERYMMNIVKFQNQVILELEELELQG